MDLTVDGVPVTIPGLEQDHLDAIYARLRELLGMPPDTVKPRDAIQTAFAYALQICPDANASDLWHHVIYREFVRTVAQVRHVDAKQSWVRASGDAFELFLQEYYNAWLASEEICLAALFSRRAGRDALVDMGIESEVGGSKLDLSVRASERILGGIHAKVSLAERVSDDVPASNAMMRRGYLSALVTLDVKSFPPTWNLPEARAYQNRGELGTPEAPSDKRRYVEEHGSFDICVSYNLRTTPSPTSTPSGKRIYTARLGDLARDPLEEAIPSRR